MKVTAIIQARMTSTRLPGKVLKKVLNKSLLEYQLERVACSKLIDEIIVATTLNESDDAIVELCKKLGVSIYRGSEVDVLSRYYEASKQYNTDIVVRLTSDCPLIEPKVIDQVIQMYLKQKFDYVSNTQLKTFPRGMDTEVFSSELLESAYYNGIKDYEREHVTPYFYLNKNQYSIGQLIDEEDNSNYRLTVDTAEDLELITIILEKLYPENKEFNLDEIIKTLKENPKLVAINGHIEQKELGE
ncbi:glycosyltransferase family protein [Sporosarcina sp. resist]|uniref:cytidylyltransferase domain-containing protein n=1 Tax=Sporosarcina sp. resist TaxID=2762563 RepID=UPI00164EA3F4|nr:glycosyltransferase family protein [Sporosarcina sp. resist]QNK87244.1 glycosyltransferase family protein [Sporosarcina sp. resist]